MSAGCDDGDMRRDPGLDDRLAEQLLRGHPVVSEPGDRLLADALAALRQTPRHTGPRPDRELQRIFASGVGTATDPGAAPAPATLPRKRTAPARGWRPARLTIRAAGLGLIIKLALGAAVAAAVSGIGMSDGSPDATEVERIPAPDPELNLEVLQDLPPGGFGPQAPQPDGVPPSVESGDGRLQTSSPWAPGRSMDVDEPAVSSDPPGRDVAEQAPGADVRDAARDRSPHGDDAPGERSGPPAGVPDGRSERVPGPPAPAPPAGDDGRPGPGAAAGDQPDAVADPSTATDGPPRASSGDDGDRPGFVTSGGPPAQPDDDARPSGPDGRGPTG